MTPLPGVEASAPVVEDQATRLRALMAAAATPAAGAGATAPLVLPRLALGAQDLRVSRSPACSPVRMDAPQAATAPCPARIVAVASGKGGVGKTNISVNLCASLAEQGQRVILLDGDLSLANADVICGVAVNGHLGHVIEGSRTLEQILIDVPAGFRLAPGAAGLARFVDAGLGRRHEILWRLSGLDEGVDVVVIDCGAGIGAGVMSFVRAADLTLVVTTPEPTAIADAYALIKCAHAECGRAVGRGFSPALVVNQARDAADAATVQRRMSGVCERFLGFKLAEAGWISSDPHVSAAVRERRPFLRAYPRCRAARDVRGVGTRLAERLRLRAEPERERIGLLGRLFGVGEK